MMCLGMNASTSFENSPNSSACPRQIVIIGGVAGGASAAARLRRLDEFARIIVIERGPDVSFANCGLPYYVGGEIQQRELLAVQTPASLRAMLKLEVRVRTEATAIHREEKWVKIQDLQSGATERLPYDTLVLTPGASPLVPPIPGIEHPDILTLRNLQDMDRIVTKAADSRHALVVGAGFIGLEMAEQLHHLGKEVTVVELQDQVLPQLDIEMARPVLKALRNQGIQVHLSDGVQAFEHDQGRIRATLQSGLSVETDMVILSIGVRPESQLARDAGLELGDRGHIRVNAFMQTSDPHIYAAGDVVEGRCAITGQPSNVPLGGPANRQGRIIADHIVQPDSALPYPGSLGTAIVRVFGIAAGITGLNEKRLTQLGIAFRKTIVSDFDHASYYPGAERLTVKLLSCPDTGRLLGAQVAGPKGVDKRLDVLATALRGKMTLSDLEHLELSYAPPFGSAKDPVNIAAFCARNQSDGHVQCVHTLPSPEEGFQIVDVRPEPARKLAPIEGAIAIPLPELRQRLHEIDAARPVLTLCSFGKMSYFAARVLRQHGFDVRSFAGGTETL